MIISEDSSPSSSKLQSPSSSFRLQHHLHHPQASFTILIVTILTIMNIEHHHVYLDLHSPILESTLSPPSLPSDLPHQHRSPDCHHRHHHHHHHYYHNHESFINIIIPLLSSHHCQCLLDNHCSSWTPSGQPNNQHTSFFSFDSSCWGFQVIVGSI